jgi:tRNA (adenine57-N1/adenine58-N1)-methyltransferase
MIEVEELLLRKYKPVPQRLRPEDRMVAHTGYLIFARKLELDEDFGRLKARPPEADEAPRAD